MFSSNITIIKSIYFWWGIGIVIVILWVILRNLKKKTAQQASPNPIEAIIIKPEVECPYCHTKFQEKDIVILCPNCKTLHHKDCWLENRGCAIFGCWQRK